MVYDCKEENKFVTEDGVQREVLAQRKYIISNDGAQVEVYAFGATLTKWSIAGGESLIWLSSTAKLDATKAIRGGIPLVFPQFGAPIKEMAQHGFARNSVWYTDEFSLKEDCFSLYLDNTKATHDAWKSPYKLRFDIRLTASKLVTEYVVENTGSEAFTFQSLQHTYLNVGDIAKTSIRGLKGQRFMDKTSPDPTALFMRNVIPQPSANSLTESSLVLRQR